MLKLLVKSNCMVCSVAVAIKVEFDTKHCCFLFFFHIFATKAIVACGLQQPILADEEITGVGSSQSKAH